LALRRRWHHSGGGTNLDLIRNRRHSAGGLSGAM
jgi:hypothetical protein